MNIVRPPATEPVDRQWMLPLEFLAEALARSARHGWFQLADFRLVGRVSRGSRDTVFIYEHIPTGRHLNLDMMIRSYRFVPPRPGSRSDGRYVLHRHFADGVELLRAPPPPGDQSSSVSRERPSLRLIRGGLHG
jgi:hypothetical protein